jgi:hypothetical protein
MYLISWLVGYLFILKENHFWFNHFLNKFNFHGLKEKTNSLSLEFY